MATIRLTNTRTRRMEEFVPLDPANVRIYVCGPTVYDRAHLGNARPVVVFDVLFRLLRHVYGAEHVTYVRNFTDVDDKINAAALARQKAGDQRPLEVLIRERTEETIAWYHADMGDLGALRPTAEPRATEWIGAMIAMIGTLIERGHAYVAEGHVLFAVESYAAYGALSGRTVEDMIAGARVEVAPFKRNPMDFVLWKPSDAQTPGWESPWGRGRPGWHIECSAMSQALLGDTFDIHGGGIDLQFPHHENEIAQSACAHPGAGFARYWLHNEMLLVEGKKMSKSLGNFFTVRDLLDQKVPGEVIRFVMLMTHYRKPMDWTEAKRREALIALECYHGVIFRLLPNVVPDPTEPDSELVNALADDLNSHGALQALRTLFALLDREPWDQLNPEAQKIAQLLANSLDFLGLYNPVFEKGTAAMVEPELLARLAEGLSDLRVDAIATRDFARVDAMKAALVEAGIEVRMSKNGVDLVPGPGFDATKLEAL